MLLNNNLLKLLRNIMNWLYLKFVLYSFKQLMFHCSVIYVNIYEH